MIIPETTFNEFHSKLMFFDIVRKMTNEIVPKYVLWDKFKFDRVNVDELINLTHPDYLFKYNHERKKASVLTIKS